MGKDIVCTKLPLNGVAWYPGGSIKSSRILHNICFFLFHFLPAIFVDALLVVLGYKPVLMKVQQRITKGFEVFEYYANNQWDFDNENAITARTSLNPRERQLYKLDGSGLNYKDYFTDCIHSARIFILKETDDTIPAAKRHMKVMWLVDKVFQGVCYLGFLYLIWAYMVQPIFAK